MIKKILFIIILAGLGFGIYTGISKIVNMVNTPKDTTAVVSTIDTGKTETITEDTSGSSVEENINISPEAVVDTQEPNWFTRTWENIKGWFASVKDKTQNMTETEIIETNIVESGNIISGEILLSGEVFDWGKTTSGETFSGEISQEVSSGSMEIDTNSEMTTGKNVTPEKTITTTGVTKNPTTTVVVKKPITTTKNITTTKSDTDPLLDSLFK